MSRTATAAKVTRSYGVSQRADCSSSASVRKQRTFRWPRRPAPTSRRAAKPFAARLHVVPRAPNECQFRAGVATQCKKLRRRCRCIHLFKLCETGDVRGAYDPHALRLKRAALFRVGEVHRGREQQAILEIRKPCPARRGLVQRYQFFAFG